MSYLVITVHTEASNNPDPLRNDISHISEINFLTDQCEKYNYLPTYLLTYEMATRDRSINIIKEILDKNKCEVGSHLHIWSTPPFVNANKYGIDIDYLDGIQSELDDETFFSKMNNLHQAIIDNFGINPKSHCAGRWAIDLRTLKWLIEKKYSVDSSICAYKTWKGTKGIKSYIETDSIFSPKIPYYPSIYNIAHPAKSVKDKLTILEVPVSGFEGDYYWKLARTVKKIISNNHYSNQSDIKIDELEYPQDDISKSVKPRLLSLKEKLFEIIKYKPTIGSSFRPSSNLDINSFEKKLHKLFSKRLPVYNFMFHSSELGLYTSHFTDTPEKLSAIKNRIELTLRLARSYDIEGIKISDLKNKLVK